ncbi:phosphoribosylformylglycinamidine synthase subunit PurS [Humisphaera borealis]|uniref:Phosphoribosylformylglycinamidine synthase subunit PurL n=1 Tax=Humisphaera borealis TaxID=2807512 RepID=A0A7M2X3D4_9BACT|nr:phosphoribosylformylglycinamidine synthase subunit PurS [Humisphaera borealis]QOV91942.1 phosphoribosylformylglycinamidine synthase subunit PurS [Humisphaera borealis]
MIYRIDVRSKVHAGSGVSDAAALAAQDSLGASIRQQIAEFGSDVGPISTSRVFFLDTDASAADVLKIAGDLLADLVVESAEVVERSSNHADPAGTSRIEVHLKPGVMDPVADSTEMAIRDMGLNVREVRTGRAFLIHGVVAKPELERIAGRVLANGVVESVHFDRYLPEKFAAGHEYTLKLQHVALRELTDEQLTKLSREGHLFLSLAEMKAIQSYYREQGREPTDIELETLAQTWSEHCVHKTLKSAVDIEVKDVSGKVVGKRHYDNLIKETIFDSTMALMGKGNAPAKNDMGRFCLSVFKDNAGVVAFDDVDAVCFKVETHNHPSAIEPYGGSATGAGGVIRDILGTGLVAKPIANTDVFCVAYPQKEKLPKGVIHPKRILQQVVAGVRDYGNRMGIPTINGAVYFDDRYLGNPLVFCGCVGLLPRNKIEKATQPGDAIVVMGGRTGRDGIHGATFSSAELTDTHADEFSHAVQIGNAITEKKVGDVILTARDRGLFTAVTDCGAGGLSSAVGEMGEKTGADVKLDTVPLKYQGLRYDEIWISEAQERMVLSVPQNKLAELLALAKSEDVEATAIGTFGTPNAELLLSYKGTQVGRISMHFMHNGIPMPRRKAVVVDTPAANDLVAASQVNVASNKVADKLLALLAHPNIASKHWVVRQYDHEVQGGSVIKPFVGPSQVGPSDASVIRPKLDSLKGVVVGCGLVPHIKDPYAMAIASIDEAIRNVVAVGANPKKTAILDNFCWPSVDDEVTMGHLARTCEACRDAALAYGIPFISGKDSLHNQFTNSETGQVLRIPNTLLISAISVIDDVRKCITMDLKKPDSSVFLLSPPKGTGPTDLAALPKVHQALADAIALGYVASCHDVSDGGALTAAAEMCIGSGLGMAVSVPSQGDPSLFAELPGRYLLEISKDRFQHATEFFAKQAVALEAFGRVIAEPKLVISEPTAIAAELSIEQMTAAWRGTLDW